MDAADLTTFLTNTPAGQVLLNLAASYVVLLLENGRTWIDQKRLGKPAQRALKDAANLAFAALLAEARKSYPHNRDAHEEAVGAALQRLLAHPGMADRLLDDALTHDRLDLPWLETQWTASGAAERLTAIPFDLGRCFGVWRETLALALQRAAADKPDLLPSWMVANLATVRESSRRTEKIAARIEEKLDQLSPQAPPAPLPTVIPEPRAALLVGRDADLEWLCQRLRAGGQTAVVGVRGLGGIGKTELAIAAAHALEREFAGGVLWLECGANDIASVQDRLALGQPLASSDLRARGDALFAALCLRPRTLLVLDDVRSVHAAGFAYLKPPTPPCALLVTRRRADLPRPLETRALVTFTPAQAHELLAFLLEEQGVAAAPLSLKIIPITPLPTRRSGWNAG